MNELYCPKCGKKHGSANKHCQYCGENLEFIILKLKQKHLPIRYQIETPHLDEEKMQEIEKNISEYEKTEEELSKFYILPEIPPILENKPDRIPSPREHPWDDLHGRAL